MQRVHVSDKPLEAVISKDQDSANTYKPTGLWYGVDGDWFRWCRGEEWSVASGDLSKLYLYEFDLGLSSMLVIRTVGEIDAFNAEYSYDKYPGLQFDSKYIRWDQVAEKYSGIEIAPYLWPRRMAEGFMWYYGWDCASGCVWSSAAVLNFRLIKPEEVKYAVEESTTDG